MPIYEYQCTACQHELEKLQKVSDEPLRICPECNEPALRKKISAAGFRLKGGGWYETDFKNDKRRNLAGDKEGASPAKDGAAAGGAKTDGSKGKAAKEPVSSPAKTGSSAGSASD